MKFTLVRADQDGAQALEYDYQSDKQSDKPDSKARPMVLDVLLQAETTAMPDLAYRYGCRNGLCGVCTVNVNGKSRLACRTKVREGDTISAMSSLPVLRDMVVKRDAINRQLVGRVPSVSSSQSTENDDAYLSLNRCIECYACVEGCPMHEENDLAASEYTRGNPFSLLKLQQVRVNTAASDEDKHTANQYALELGLETCISCKGCSCGVGIDLVGDVIRPLLDANDLEHASWK